MRAKRLRRQIGFSTEHCCFKPYGVRNRKLEQVYVEEDKLEVIRLIDYKGL